MAWVNESVPYLAGGRGGRCGCGCGCLVYLVKILPPTFCLTLGSGAGAPLQERLPSRTRPLRGSRAGPLEDPERPWKTLKNPGRPWILRGCSKGTHGHARAWASARPRQFGTTVHQPAFPPETLQTEAGARPGQGLGMEILNSHAAAAALAVQAFQRKDERPIRSHCECSRQSVPILLRARHIRTASCAFRLQSGICETKRLSLEQTHSRACPYPIATTSLASPLIKSPSLPT